MVYACARRIRISADPLQIDVFALYVAQGIDVAAVHLKQILLRVEHALIGVFARTVCIGDRVKMFLGCREDFGAQSAFFRARSLKGMPGLAELVALLQHHCVQCSLRLAVTGACCSDTILIAVKYGDLHPDTCYEGMVSAVAFLLDSHTQVQVGDAACPLQTHFFQGLAGSIPGEIAGRSTLQGGI
jgi:hypothetical protein